MKYVLITINAFLLGACMFSISQYAASINEKYSLIDSIENEKMLITAVSKEKQNLLQTLEKEKEINKQAAQKNLLLKNNLNASVKKIGKLFTKFVEINNKMDELMLQMSILKQENKAIREEENKLKFDLSMFTKQNEQLNARFNSISELKKAIRELKRLKIKDNLKAGNNANAQVQIAANKEAKIDTEITEGNQGFLIKGIKRVSAVKVKIEVKPALKYE